jgi:hypothetical protein
VSAGSAKNAVIAFQAAVVQSNEFQRDLADFRIKHPGDLSSDDAKRELQPIYSSVAAKVYTVMTAYAQEHGYLVVFDISQQAQSPIILYADQSVNITQAVIDAYNLKSGVLAPQHSGAASAAPAAAPAKGGQGTTVTTNCSGVSAGPHGEIIPTNCTTQ